MGSVCPCAQGRPKRPPPVDNLSTSRPTAGMLAVVDFTDLDLAYLLMFGAHPDYPAPTVPLANDHQTDVN